MVLYPDVRAMGLVNNYLFYIFTSPDVRGMGLVNYYLGYIITSPDVRRMTLVYYYQAKWSLLLILEE